MTTIFIQLLLVSLFYVLVFGYECGISYNQENSNSHIINGRDLEGDWPWIVSIFHNGVMICTGSIISPRFVLTAAHCYNEVMLNKKKGRHSFSIHAGSVYATEGEVVRVFWNNIKTFDEGVSERTRNDIALFKLERPLVFNNNVSSICLPKFFEEFPGSMAFLAGFGNVLSEDHNDPNRAEDNALLNDVSIPFQDFKHCKKASQSWNYTSLNYICAGARMKGSAKGDSGGPLMIKDLAFQQDKLKYRWFAVGVVVGGKYLSSNKNDTLQWSHTLYTRVSHYCDWIEEVTDGDAQCIDVGRQFLPTKSTFTTKILPKAQPSNGNNNGKSVNPVFQCTDGYQYFAITNSCYKYDNISLYYNDAEKYCKNQSGHLVSIHSLEEDEIVSTMYYQKNTAWGVLWIGLNDFTGNYHHQYWSWTDGSPVNYTNWYIAPERELYPGPCTQYITKNSRHMHGKIYWQHEFTCNQALPFVCKQNPILS